MAILRDLMRLMRGRWLWAIVLGLIGAAGGGAAGWQLAGEPNFRSTGQIHILPVVPKVMYNLEDKGNVLANFVQSQVEVMKSRRVIDLAMQSDFWKAAGGTRTEEDIIEFMRPDRLSIRRSESGEMIYVSFTHPNAKRAEGAVKAIVNSYKTIFEERDVRSDANLRSILESLKMNLINEQKSVKDRILAMASESGTDSLEQNYQFKMQELHKVESELRQAQVTLALMNAAVEQKAAEGAPKDAPAPEPGKTEQPSGAAAKPAAGEPQPVTPVDSKTIEQASLQTPQIDPTVGEQLSIDEIARRDATMAQLVFNKQRLEQEMAEKATTLGPEHRLMVQIRAQIAATEQTINERAGVYRSYKDPAAAQVGTPTGSGAPTQLQSVVNRVMQLQKLFDSLNKETMQLGQRRLQIETLKDDLASIEQRLSETRRRIEEITVEAPMRVSGRMEIISDGSDVRPAEDYSKLLISRISMGAAAGLLMGFGIVALFGLLDQRFEGPDDARGSFSKTTILGVLPELPDDLADAEQARLAAHAVHYIRAMLQLGINRHGRRLLAITSAQAGDGKTSLSLSLGYSFAATGVRTLLIDSDMTAGTLTKRVRSMVPRKLGEILLRDKKVGAEQLEEALLLASGNGRKLGEILVELGYLTSDQLQMALDTQVKSHLGISDVLGGADLLQCVYPAGVPNLSILPRGMARADDAMRISPEQAVLMLKQARDNFDMILIDTAPVLGGLESSMICAEADATILVVSRGTQRLAVNRAMDQLRSIQATLAGIVFNRAETREFNRYAQSTSAQSLLYRDANEQPASSAPGSAPAKPTSRFGPMVSAVAGQKPTGPGPGPGVDG
jgi:Mrp family chromosome partitioning ATPase